MNKAVFLDRDGVINSVANRNGFSPRSFKDFEILPGVKETIDKFKELGYLVFIITNQPDIARNLMQIEELEKMHSLVNEQFNIDDIEICPHENEDNCSCRKPKPGMIFNLAEKWNVDVLESVFIGDSKKDYKAAKAANIKFLYVRHDYNEEIEDVISIPHLKHAITYL